VSIAFFDFDRTLIAINSGALWVRKELGAGQLSPFLAMRAFHWLARYQLGFATLDDAVKKAISMLAGVRESELRDRTIQFYEQHVRSTYRPGARQAVEEHRGRGDKLVLLTSTSLYLSELVARDLKFDAILCNRFEVSPDGVHTGKPVGEVCFGSGKRCHAEAYAKEAGVQLKDTAFYTDSYSDLPVLEVVGNPVAVNPDRRLRRVAVQRKWPVVDWGAPARAA
jgi:HAD superfamily hydrolase (TIGR01490 family)